MKQQWIGLLDCNNFFVSCERLFRPDLIGKPVLVLSSNDGCVVARSQEVKDIGVLMGVPYFQIKDIVKKYGITTFSSHFTLYRDISRRVFSVMREELDVVEQYSIDEAFFTFDGEPFEVASRVRSAVEKKVGIPVSVGVAHTKTQAKYANDLAKKGGGVRVLDEADWTALTPSILLADIWGVGGKMELRFKRHGLQTVAQFLAADPARIERLFGVNGLRLQHELSGNIAFPLHHRTAPQQSITSTRSFRDTTSDKSILSDAVAYHVRHALADLRGMGLLARTIKVIALPSRHGDFFLRGGVKEAILPTPSNDTIEFLKVANELLSTLFEPGVPYKKTGVVLSELIPNGDGQTTLFGETDTTKNAGLMAVIDDLNAKSGGEVVLLGSHLRSNAWRSRSETCSPAYTTRWSDIASVKTK